MFDKNSMRNQIAISVSIFLGCSLLLLGNTLYWPCHPGSWRGLCDPSLYVFVIDDLGVGIFTAGITLMLLLEIRLLKHPMNRVAWASYWIILYFLLIAKIRADSTFPSFHYTWVDINWSLVTIAVTPLSLLSYWLVLRPQDIKQKYRKLTLVCLISLLTITIFLLLFAVIALDLRMRYSFELKEIVRIAPVVILTGALLLIGAEYSEMQVGKQRSARGEEEEQKDSDEIESDVMN